MTLVRIFVLLAVATALFDKPTPKPEQKKHGGHPQKHAQHVEEAQKGQVNLKAKAKKKHSALDAALGRMGGAKMAVAAKQKDNVKAERIAAKKQKIQERKERQAKKAAANKKAGGKPHLPPKVVHKKKADKKEKKGKKHGGAPKPPKVKTAALKNKKKPQLSGLAKKTVIAHKHKVVDDEAKSEKVEEKPVVEEAKAEKVEEKPIAVEEAKVETVAETVEAKVEAVEAKVEAVEEAAKVEEKPVVEAATVEEKPADVNAVNAVEASKTEKKVEEQPAVGEAKVEDKPVAAKVEEAKAEKVEEKPVTPKKSKQQRLDDYENLKKQIVKKLSKDAPSKPTVHTEHVIALPPKNPGQAVGQDAPSKRQAVKAVRAGRDRLRKMMKRSARNTVEERLVKKLGARDVV